MTENYSSRDINHHLRNEAAICLEGSLKPTKAKFKMKVPQESCRERRPPFQKEEAKALMSYFMLLADVLCGMESDTPLAHFKRGR